MRVNNSNLRNLVFSAILGIFSVTVAHAGTCVQGQVCKSSADCGTHQCSQDPLKEHSTCHCQY